MSLQSIIRRSLAYIGVNPTETPELLVVNREPTAKDIKLYKIGTLWIESEKSIHNPSHIWALTNVLDGIAHWESLTSSGFISEPEHAVLLSSGIGNPINSISPGPAGEALISGGPLVDPTFGVVGISGGGKGVATVAVHNLLVGNGTAAPNLVAPSSTVGYPLTSTGSSSDPVYSTLEIVGGGTGVQTFNEYAVLCGGTTDAGPLQQVNGTGTAGQMLTSNGAGMLPSWQDKAQVSVNVIVFNSSGTYTPSSGMKYCDVECQAAGGGSAGLSSIGYGHGMISQSGAGGGYARRALSSAEIGASQTVTVGVGGLGGIASSGSKQAFAGTAGGNSSFGSYMTCTGGSAGTLYADANYIDGVSGGSATGGDINIAGQDSDASNNIVTSCNAASPYGGGSVLAPSTMGVTTDSSTVKQGNDGIGYGAGGSGSCIFGGQFINGASGSNGVVIVTEYIE